MKTFVYLSTHCLIGLVFLVFILNEIGVRGDQEQSVSFFEGQNCAADTFIGTVYNTTNLNPIFGTALSFSINGVYVIIQQYS